MPLPLPRSHSRSLSVSLPSKQQVQCAPKNLLLLLHKLDKVAHTHTHTDIFLGTLQNYRRRQASPSPTPTRLSLSLSSLFAAWLHLQLYDCFPAPLPPKGATATAAVTPIKSVEYPMQNVKFYRVSPVSYYGSKIQFGKVLPSAISFWDLLKNFMRIVWGCNGVGCTCVTINRKSITIV